jgi:hypothetical protein
MGKYFIFSNKKHLFFVFFVFSSSYGGQQMVRRPTIVQADQTVVPQSYGQQQLQLPQRPLVSQQQLLLDQQQLSPKLVRFHIWF